MAQEPSVKCLAAEPADSGEHFGAIAGLQRPDSQRCPVAQASGNGVRGGVHRRRPPSVGTLRRYFGGYALSMMAAPVVPVVSAAPAVLLERVVLAAPVALVQAQAPAAVAPTDCPV